MGGSSKTYVAGSLSRIRPDNLIQNTLKYVVAGAATGNEDIGEAIRTNAIVGTVGTYHSYFRFAKKYLAEPTVRFSYYSPDINNLATTIRQDTGNSYPTTINANNVTLGFIIEDNFVKYYLQEDFNYNLTTNILVKDGISYYLGHYKRNTDFLQQYTIDCYRKKIITATVTKNYSVSYDDINTKWVIDEAVTTEESWEYLPYAEGDLTVNTVHNFSDYDDVVDPWEFGSMTQGVTYYPCDNVDFEYLCEPQVTNYSIFSSAFEPTAFANNSGNTIELENISFTLPYALFEKEILVYDESSGTSVLTANLYWQVKYTEAGREYIWIGSREDYPVALGSNVEVLGDNSGFGRFAPIVPFKDNFQYFQEGESRYTSSRKVLKRINIKMEELIDQLKNSSGSEDIADAYVINASKLASNDMDELAYNYAFFKALFEKPFDGYVNSFDPESGEYPDELLSGMSLHVVYEDIYNQTITWSNIEHNTVEGTLSNEYEASLASGLDPQEGEEVYKTSSGSINYVVKKRLTSTSYSEFTVHNLRISFYVGAGGGGKAYSPDLKGGPDETDQFVIPLSIQIAKDNVRRDLETLYLRTAHVGVFSYKVVKKKWYQSGIFAAVLFVAALVFCQACLTAVLNMGVVVGASLGVFTVGMSFAVAMAVAFVIGLATYALISYAIQKVLFSVLKAVGFDSFLGKLIAAVYVIVRVWMGGFSNIFQALTTMMNAYIDTLKVGIELASLELKELSLQLEKLTKESAAILKEDLYEARKHGLEIINFFRGPQDQITESDLDSLLNSPEFLYTSTKEFVSTNKQLIQPPELILASEELVSS